MVNRERGVFTPLFLYSVGVSGAAGASGVAGASGSDGTSGGAGVEGASGGAAGVSGITVFSGGIIAIPLNTLSKQSATSSISILTPKILIYLE